MRWILVLWPSQRLQRGVVAQRLAVQGFWRGVLYDIPNFEKLLDVKSICR